MTKRLHILSEAEIQRIYAHPSFNQEDREYYFTLEPQEEAALNLVGSSNSQFYFVLQLGYFKAKQQFFNFNEAACAEDRLYVQQRYFPALSKIPARGLSKPTRLQLQSQILKLMDHQLCSIVNKQQLERLASAAVSIDSKPLFLFKELLNFLQKHRIVLPGYTYLQDLISQTIATEEKRLAKLLQEQLTEDIKIALDKLLQAENSLHELTYLKKEPRDFGLKQMTEEIKKMQQLRFLYNVAQQLLPLLTISAESIHYYASLVNYYTVYKLKRLNNEKVYVYLLAFVYYRYQKMNDHLVECFLHYVNRYSEAGRQASKTAVSQQQINCNKQLKQAAKILQLFIVNRWDEHLFSEVKSHAFSFLPEERFQPMMTYLNKQQLDPATYEWDYYQQIARTFKLHLRPLLLNLDIATASSHPVSTQLAFLKEKLEKGKNLQEIQPKHFPMEHIPPAIKRYLYDRDISQSQHKLFNPNKYEFMIYQQLKQGLEAGDIFIKQSRLYRSFDDDLVNDNILQNKDNIFNDLGLVRLNTPITTLLNELEQELEGWIHRVNLRLQGHDNPYIHRKGKAWVLPYPKSDEPENHPLYQQLPQISIADLLLDNHAHCQFLDQFTHITGRYQKQEANHQALIASITALGTYLGLGKMGEISDINYHKLTATTHNFIRLETLRKANDVISNAIAALPICKHYNILDDIIHASSDGSKIETQIPTFNARYSSKYFGLKKGISAITLVANHIPLNARIIGAHEHESHYVYDLIANNTSKVDPDILSTDTHGINHVNFAILFLFDYLFAPRFKDTAGKIESIYGFHHPRFYQDLLIKPTRKINTELIMSEWPNILKIMLSLATKATTQSIIVRKLSSYERKNRTKSALWEFDHIIRSIHILRYIDDITYRQGIQKALNRGESYHKLRRAVSYANGGKLKVRTELAQQIYNECGRLLANNIILYNARLLSKLLALKEESGSIEDIEKLKTISPVAWQHINVYGRYEFGKMALLKSLDEVATQLDLLRISEKEVI